MPTVLVDYTPLYYISIARTPVPPGVVGKFIQIRNGNTLYLILSPKEFTKYHAHIIERFCIDKGIEGSYDSRKGKFNIHDQAWVIIGGGKFERDTSKKSIKLYDNSMAYGKFDAAGLNEMLAALPEFSDYSIIIE